MFHCLSSHMFFFRPGALSLQHWAIPTSPFLQKMVWSSFCSQLPVETLAFSFLLQPMLSLHVGCRDEDEAVAWWSSQSVENWLFLFQGSLLTVSETIVPQLRTYFWDLSLVLSSVPTDVKQNTTSQKNSLTLWFDFNFFMDASIGGFWPQRTS